jgi:hypothetical protein
VADGDEEAGDLVGAMDRAPGRPELAPAPARMATVFPAPTSPVMTPSRAVALAVEANHGGRALRASSSGTGAKMPCQAGCGKSVA